MDPREVKSEPILSRFQNGRKGYDDLDRNKQIFFHSTLNIDISVQIGPRVGPFDSFREVD